MKTDKSTWNQKMNNLIERRNSSSPSISQNKIYNPLSDYKSHLSKIKIGKSVLDVGCGSMIIKNLLPPGIAYTGIDAFPVSDEIQRMQIEEINTDVRFDTIFAFAVLDGVHDLGVAIDKMKNICNKNIFILTGIDIEIDKFHTFKISENFLIESMKPFNIGYKNWLSNKVLLIEFIKNEP